MSRIRTNTAALGLSFFGTAVLAFVQVKVLTTYLTDSGFGTWITVGGIGALLGTLTELGLPQVIVRFGAKYDAQDRLPRLRRLVWFSLRVHVVCWVVMVLLILVAGGIPGDLLGKPDLSRRLLLVGYLALASGTPRAINNGVFRSLRSMPYVAGLEILFSFLVAVGYYGLRDRLTVELTFEIFIACSLFVAVLGFAVLFRLLSRLTIGPDPAPHESVAREVRAYWQGAAAAGVFLVAIEFLDKPLLAALVTFQQVGLFGVASRLSLFARRLLYVPMQVLNPEITHKWEGGRREELARDMRLFIKLELGLGILLLVPLAVLARPVILLVSTPEYLPAAHVLWMFLLVLPLLCLHQPMVLFLRAVGSVWAAFAADASWLTVYLGVGGALVGPFGLPGFVAAQTVASLWVLSYTLWAFDRRGYPRPGTGFFVKRALVAAVSWALAVAGGRIVPPGLPWWGLLGLGAGVLLVVNAAMVWGGFLTHADEQRTLALLAGRGPVGRAARFAFAWPRKLTGRGGAAALMLLVAGSGLGCSHLSPGCSTDDEVPGKIRKQVEAAAADFYAHIAAEDAQWLFINAAAPIREKSSVEEFVTPIAKEYFQFGLPEHPVTEHLHVVDIVPGEPIQFPVPCTGADGSEVSLRLTQLARTQASLVQHGMSRGYDVRVSTLWFREKGGWRVGGIDFKPGRVEGKDAQGWFQTADEQQQKGNLRNAAILYNLVAELATPNPWTDVPFMTEVQERQAGITVTYLPSDRLMPWDVDGETFNVWQVAYTVSEVGLNLMVNYEVSDLADTTALLGDMNALRDFVITNFPEYPEVFRGLTIRAGLKGSLKTVGYSHTWPLGPGDGE